jgi:hypothetical protein
MTNGYHCEVKGQSDEFAHSPISSCAAVLDFIQEVCASNGSFMQRYRNYKGSWRKPDKEGSGSISQALVNAIDEIYHRGLNMRDFSHRLLSEADWAKVYRAVPSELAEMLSGPHAV